MKEEKRFNLSFQRLEKSKLYDIDLDELRKEVIGSEEDKLKNEHGK